MRRHPSHPSQPVCAVHQSDDATVPAVIEWRGYALPSAERGVPLCLDHALAWQIDWDTRSPHHPQPTIRLITEGIPTRRARTRR